MNIILMRHGEAVPFAANDGDRILTPNGEGEASNTGTQLKQAGWNLKQCFVRHGFGRSRLRSL